MEANVKLAPACQQAQEQMPKKHQYIDGVCNICGCPKDEGGGGTRAVCYCFKGWFSCKFCGQAHETPGVSMK